VAALALVAATALPASAEPAPRTDVKYAPAEIARPGEYLVEKAAYGDAPSTTIGTWLTDNATPGAVNGDSTPGPTPNLLLNTAGL